MWEIFLSTGNIDAYLAYRACLDCHTSQPESVDESTELLAVPEYLWNNLLREVRWQ
ncbi:YqzL family protein [Sporomusa malonica]|uniref:YqzL family protein n=1 Tax=Sporomusa malonica TaxID=112901 RepID=UPI00352B7796